MKKKIMVLAVVAAIVMSMFVTGCGSTSKKDDSRSNVCTEFTDNGTVDEKGNKWIKHSFYSDNAEFAYKQAQNTADFYLTHGYIVSEIIEDSTYSGSRYYYFKTKIG